MKRRREHRNHHHLRPRSRRGSSGVFNLLYLDCDKHRKLHEIFGNRTLEEIISVLIRLSKMKHYEREESTIQRFYKEIPHV